MSRPSHAGIRGICAPTIALVLPAVLAGCAVLPGADPDPGMVPHFFRVGLVHDAAIHGDVERAREHALQLVQQGDTAPLPRGSEAYVERLAEAARDAAAAPDLHTMGMQTAAMAAACGACHAALEGGPDLPTPGVPEAGGAERPHTWAAARMWEGLLAPSNRHWQAGAQVLARAPFAAARGRMDVAGLAVVANRIGQEAQQVRDDGQRARLYGELLTTCAACHRPLGVSPR